MLYYKQDSTKCITQNKFSGYGDTKPWTITTLVKVGYIVFPPENGLHEQSIYADLRIMCWPRFQIVSIGIYSAVPQRQVGTLPW